MARKCFYSESDQSSITQLALERVPAVSPNVICRKKSRVLAMIDASTPIWRQLKLTTSSRPDWLRSSSERRSRPTLV
ncbi:MAG: hypothetical protein JWP25_7401 [Bradyrhizobium sp.]|nr:hypothetical protein [Bradyrhizobium sp.]